MLHQKNGHTTGAARIWLGWRNCNFFKLFLNQQQALNCVLIKTNSCWRKMMRWNKFSVWGGDTYIIYIYDAVVTERPPGLLLAKHGELGVGRTLEHVADSSIILGALRTTIHFRFYRHIASAVAQPLHLGYFNKIQNLLSKYLHIQIIKNPSPNGIVCFYKNTGRVKTHHNNELKVAV